MKIRKGIWHWPKVKKGLATTLMTITAFGYLSLSTQGTIIAQTSTGTDEQTSTVITPTNDPMTTESLTVPENETENETTTDTETPSDAESVTPTAEAEPSPTDNQEIPSGGSVYDDHPDLNNILGIASQFHIFAREASLHTHTAGNLAVALLHDNANFGTTNVLELLDRDITYIQKIDKLSSSSFVSAGNIRDNKVIFGEGISIDISNRERPLVNGVHLGNLDADEVYQDRDGQVYIDFDSEFAKLAQTNLALSQQTPQKHYTAADFPEMNTREIDIRQFTPDENGQIVISLAAEVLSIVQPLRIRGLSTEATGNTIVINVDTEGQANYNSNSPIIVFYGDDKEPRSNKDADDYGDNHLLWNFHNQQQPLTGTLQFNGCFQGSVLAPSANLIATKNMDGNLIANRVQINAESHRWDLQDSSAPEEEDEEKEKPGTDEEEEDEEKPGTDEEEDLEEPDKPDPDEEEDPEEPEKPDPGEEEDLEEPDKPDPGEEEDLEEPEKPDPGEEDPEPETPAVPDPSPEVEELTTTDTESPSQLGSDLDAALALPASQRPAAVKLVLRRIDTAITAAHQANNNVRATRLETLRTRGLAALSTSRLPQTGEIQSPVIATVGASLMIIMIVIGWTITKKRRRNR